MNEAHMKVTPPPTAHRISACSPQQEAQEKRDRDTVNIQLIYKFLTNPNFYTLITDNPSTLTKFRGQNIAYPISIHLIQCILIIVYSKQPINSRQTSAAANKSTDTNPRLPRAEVPPVKTDNKSASTQVVADPRPRAAGQTTRFIEESGKARHLLGQRSSAPPQTPSRSSSGNGCDLDSDTLEVPSVSDSSRAERSRLVHTTATDSSKTTPLVRLQGDDKPRTIQVFQVLSQGARTESPSQELLNPTNIRSYRPVISNKCRAILVSFSPECPTSIPQKSATRSPPITFRVFRVKAQQRGDEDQEAQVDPRIDYKSRDEARKARRRTTEDPLEAKLREIFRSPEKPKTTMSQAQEPEPMEGEPQTKTARGDISSKYAQKRDAFRARKNPEAVKKRNKEEDFEIKDLKRKVYTASSYKLNTA